MLERKPLERNEYVLPNTTAQDWELISAKWAAKELDNQLSAIKKDLYSSTFLNSPISDDLLADLKILAKYPYPLFINSHSTKIIEEIIIEACNFALLPRDTLMELAKSFSLQTELNDFLEKLNFSDEEKSAIAAHVHQEADKFFFPAGYDQDKLIKHIESIQDKNELQKFAYDFIGYHCSLFSSMHDLKEAFDQPHEIEIVKKQMIEKIKIVINNFRHEGFSHLTKLPPGFLNKVINEIDSPLSNETDLLQVSHGGGFFHLLDFFTGKSNGYALEKRKNKVVGYGIQVSPLGINREKTYAYSKRLLCLDQPAVLYAEIPKNRLQKAAVHGEAGLMTENKYHLTKIKLYNLLTKEIIEADNFEQLLKKIEARNTPDYRPKFEVWIDPAIKEKESKADVPTTHEVPAADIIKSQEQLTTENKNLKKEEPATDVPATADIIKSQEPITEENKNFNEALERFKRLKEKILKDFNQNINEKELLEFIKQIKFAKDNGSVSLLNNLSALAEVSFAAERPNELASAGANTWLHSMVLAYRILNRPHNKEEIQLLTNALENATNTVRNPANLNAAKQLLIDAEKIRTKIEGGFFDRKESRIWKGLLYGALFLIIGGTMLAGAIIAAPLAATVGTITVFVVLLNYLMAGSGLAGIFTGFCAPFVALKLSKESPDQRASRMAAESMKSLVKSQSTFFKKNKDRVMFELENPNKKFQCHLAKL